MNVTPTATLPDVLIIDPRVLRDDRGFFVETYHAPRYRAAGIDVAFVQDNHSRSVRGTLRGLHWQDGPEPETKVVRCVRGAIFELLRRGHLNAPSLHSQPLTLHTLFEPVA